MCQLAGYGSALALLMGSVARLCRALCSGAVVLGEFCRANRYCVGLVGDAAASRPVTGGGFALHEAF